MDRKTYEKLKKVFGVRWNTIKAKTKISDIDKAVLWNKLLSHFEKGFYCEYCGEALSLEIGSINIFSFDHKNNDHSVFDIDEILITCVGCNMLKRSISETNFRKMINCFKKTTGLGFLNELKREVYEGTQKGIKKASLEGKIGRPQLLDAKKKGKE